MPITKLRPAGDLALNAGVIDGPSYLAQRINCRLKFFLGEWFLDRRLGVPYYRDVLRKGADHNVVRSVLLKVVATTPGVSTVDEFLVGAGERPRSLAVGFSCTSVTGAVISSSKEFII